MDAMEAYFGADVKRINHARKVTEYAEGLLDKEDGDRAIVLGAPYCTTSAYIRPNGNTAAPAESTRR